jgi:hypothetical protein
VSALCRGVADVTQVTCYDRHDVLGAALEASMFCSTTLGAICDWECARQRGIVFENDCLCTATGSQSAHLDLHAVVHMPCRPMRVAS